MSFFLSIFVSLLFLVGCTGEGKNDNENDASTIGNTGGLDGGTSVSVGDKIAVDVSEKGASLEIGRLKMEIPEGALDKEVEIGIKVVEPPVPIPKEYKQTGYAYECTPHALEFDRPVSFEIGYIDKPEERFIVLQLSDGDDGSWKVEESSSFESSVVNFEVDHFSFFTVAYRVQRTFWEPDAEVPDAGPGQIIGGDEAIGGTGGSSGDDGPLDASQAGSGGREDDICADSNVVITRPTANLILVVDRSSSMVMSSFGDYDSRWEALRAALMGIPNGIVYRYQEIIRFGYQGYTGFSGDISGLTCPDIVSVPNALNNYDTILPVYDASRPGDVTGPIGQTPTGESLKVVVDTLETTMTAAPDNIFDSHVLLLATDGEPDTCADPNTDGGAAAARLVVDQISRAFNMGIRSYVLSVGDETSDQHLQEVANVGVGTSDAPFWKADSDRELEDSLTAILGEILPCEIELNTMTVDLSKECAGGVLLLDGISLECNAEDGWRFIDRNRIELVGSACEAFKSSPSATLEARFPCSIVISR